MFKKLLLASAMLVAAAGASAQSSTVGVGGTISPSGCTISLTGSGISDYGSLVKSTVTGYAVNAGTTPSYTMGSKTVGLNVTCASPTKLELAFVDNKATQIMPIDANDASRFGIANGSGTTPFGSYWLTGNALTINGVAPAVYLTSATGTTAWSTSGPNSTTANNFSSGYATGFSSVATDKVPAAVTTIGGSLTTWAFLNKSMVDASTGVLTLNGSTTISLQYL